MRIPSFSDTKKALRSLLISLSLLASCSIILVFAWLYYQTDVLLNSTLQHEAESYVDSIDNVRKWNAQNGGIYVEKGPGITSSEFLREHGNNPDLQCEDFRMFTLKTPCLMLTDISRLSMKNSGVRFRMISTEPANSKNTPDLFEQEALEQLNRGINTFSSFDTIESTPVYRYLKPIFLSSSCIKCHPAPTIPARCAISIIIPVKHLLAQTKTNKLYIVIIAAVSLLTVNILLYFFAWKLSIRLKESRAKLHFMENSDALTGLRNRHFIMIRLEEEFEKARHLGHPLGLIMLDLDHFKKINDTHGHLVGDLVLKSVAVQLKKTTRVYDLLGRIGGEEFIALLPDSDIIKTVTIAERLLTSIRNEKICSKDLSIQVTISAGATVLKKEDENMDDLLSRANTALDKAKHKGRNKIMIA